MQTAALALLLAMSPALQDQDRVQKLIQTLSDPSKDERSKAVDDLAKIGRPALEALRKAATSTDLEVKGLAAQAIEKIEWGGVEALKRYAKESLDEGSTVELAKLRGTGRWFPDTRFYEVAAAPPAGNNQQAMMVNMGMGSPKSLFAVRKFEEGFYRLAVKGIVAPASIGALVKKSRIVLPDDDAALDLAVAYMEIQAAAAPQNQANWMMNGGSRVERTADGWVLHSGMYGGQVTFKVDASGTLLDVHLKGASFNQWGLAGSDERQKLEIEKLKLEIDLLKRQLEKK